MAELMGSGISRRSFVTASAAAAASLALSCAPETSLAETADTAPRNYRIDTEFDETQDGEWVPVSCWTSCGGRCQLKAYVVDGMPMRIKTDDNLEDSYECFQNRACPRGRAQRMHAFGADRLKYPMKRKGWQPGGGENSNGEMRGRDEWERISWDEAYDLIAQEYARIKDTYGPFSVMIPEIPGYGTPLSNKLGGFLDGYGINLTMTSYGSWCSAPDAIGIDNSNGEAGTMGTNDRLSMLKSDLIVLHGNNPAWAAAGAPSYHLWRAHEAGIPFVFIGPEYNVTASMVEAKWIPVRPTTDGAFLSAVIYEMLKLDEEQGEVVDWDFLYKYTVGFDDDHMPADAVLDENVHGYVLGEYDGQPKTAEWAAPICGCEAEDIRWYAAQLTKQNKVSMYYAYSVARNAQSATLPQLALTLACMGGHIGAEGQQFGPTYHYFAHNVGTKLLVPGEMRGGEIPPANMLPICRLTEGWKSIVEGHGPSFFNGEDVPCDIHMLWVEGGEWITSMNDTQNAVKAFRQMDFVVTQSFNFRPCAQYADIVLPETTPWEYGYDQDAVNMLQYGQVNRETIYFPRPFAEPLYESRPNRQIIYDIMQRMGFDADKAFPYSEEQRDFDRMLNTKVLDEDGVTYKPLVTISQEEIDELGFDNEPQRGIIEYKELRERGMYHVARTEDDNYGYIAYKDFIDDPEGHPLNTVSGKWELYCQTAADMVNGQVPTDEPVKPYGCWRIGFGGYQGTFENGDYESGVKSDTPFMIYEPHYLRRAHTVHDNVGWLRQALESPAYMNPQDAAELGIESGDFVLVSNQYGKMIRVASIMETLMPGVVGLPHGNWPEFNEETGIDENGCENTITAPVGNGGPYHPYHSTNVRVEKYENQDMPYAYQRPLVTPKGIE